MKKVLAILMALSMVFAMTACGGEKEIDISNINEVVFENDGLKVTFVGAEYEESEQPGRSHFNFHFRFENKTEEPIYASVDWSKFIMNGTLCSPQEGDYSIMLSGMNHKGTFTGTVEDTLMVILSKEKKEEIGQPGQIVCFLHYSLNGEDFSIAQLSFQVGKNNNEFFEVENVTLEMVKGDRAFNDKIVMSNHNDFPVVIIARIYAADGSYYIYSSHAGAFYDSDIVTMRLDAGTENREYKVFQGIWWYTGYEVSKNERYSIAVHDADGNLFEGRDREDIYKNNIDVLFVLRSLD